MDAINRRTFKRKLHTIVSLMRFLLEMAMPIPFVGKYSDNAHFGFGFRCVCLDFTHPKENNLLSQT